MVSATSWRAPKEPKSKRCAGGCGRDVRVHDDLPRRSSGGNRLPAYSEGRGPRGKILYYCRWCTEALWQTA